MNMNLGKRTIFAGLLIATVAPLAPSARSGLFFEQDKGLWCVKSKLEIIRVD
jgi:hypothetical protein